MIWRGRCVHSASSNCARYFCSSFIHVITHLHSKTHKRSDCRGYYRGVVKKREHRYEVGHSIYRDDYVDQSAKA